MAYHIRRYETGAVIEVEKWQSLGKAKASLTPRAPKAKPTPEQMFAANERNAAAKLRRILNANFGPGDLHMTLPYKRGQAPTPQQARTQFERFLRALREHFQAEGRELKYIHVMEHLKTNLHHHFIVQHCDPQVLANLWMRADNAQRPYFTLLDNTGQYKKLAEYLIKETSQTFRGGLGAYRKRWCESKNLLHPQPKTKTVKAKAWRAAPTPDKGYIIETDSVEIGTNPFTGLVWQKYSMVRAAPERRISHAVQRLSKKQNINRTR